ncbi:putative ribosomal RNA large subunit methyltransferase J [Peptostreptococcaceae bacterium AS15]|nr:methyltransferase domain protein [[Eubacterium] yurii subsp. margaretiae ATCC 43715]EJP21782.1 putative ribosomal RNA large subunit methyltransferase J [Peptostreptococcaceae bacterium AS15]
MEQYQYLSEIYDKSMELSGIDYDKWFGKIQDLLGSDKEDIKNILELGCGTGNITQRLLEYGYEVVGVDISGEMLSIAKEKLVDFSDKVIFMQQDVCDFDFDIYEIDMILAVNDLINYITDVLDLENLFSFCYEHLRKDGILLFDISSKYKIEHILSDNVYFEEDKDYCMIWQNSYDEDEKIIDMYIDIFKQNQDGLYERYQEEHSQRAYDEDELIEVLKKVGFQNIKTEYIISNNDDKKSERIFFLMKK